MKRFFLMFGLMVAIAMGGASVGASEARAQGGQSCSPDDAESSCGWVQSCGGLSTCMAAVCLLSSCRDMTTLDCIYCFQPE